jgi:hypothetical protein
MAYRIILFVAFFLVLVVALNKCAAAAECLKSDKEVRAVHGVTAWATWHMVKGVKCYSLGRRHGSTAIVANIRLPSTQLSKKSKNLSAPTLEEPPVKRPLYLPAPDPPPSYIEETWHALVRAAVIQNYENRFNDTFGALRGLKR